MDRILHQERVACDLTLFVQIPYGHKQEDALYKDGLGVNAITQTHIHFCLLISTVTYFTDDKAAICIVAVNKYEVKNSHCTTSDGSLITVAWIAEDIIHYELYSVSCFLHFILDINKLYTTQQIYPKRK